MNKLLSSFYLRLFISLVLIAILFALVDFSETLSIFASLNPAYIFIILGLITIDRILMSIKWNVLLKARSIDISLLEIIKTYYVGNFLGSFLPPTVGIDIIRSWRLSRYEQDLPKIVSSIVIERILGFVVLSVFSLAAAAIFIIYIGMDLSKILWYNLLIVAALLAIFTISISENTHTFIESRLDFLKDSALFAKLKKGYDSYQQYKNSKKSLLLFAFLTLIELSIPITMNYFVALALHVDISFSYLVIIIPIIMFMSRIPLTLEGIGLQEGLYVVLFAFANVTPSQAFSMGLLQHVLTFLGMTPGLLIYLLDPIQKKSFDNTRSIVPSVASQESPQG